MDIRNNVLIANDGWKYLYSGDHDQFSYLLRKKEVPQVAKKNFFNNFKNRNDFCIKNNIKYIHIVFPSKPIIKPEFLPKEVSEVESLLQSECELPHNLFYPKDQLKSEPESFLKGDTHTSPKGSWEIIKLILKELELNKKVSPIFSPKKRSGDLDRMLNSNIQETFDDFVGLEGVDYKCFDVTNKNGLKGNAGIIRIMRNQHSVYDKRVVIFGDSFFNNNMNFQLSHLFREIVFFRSPVFIKDVVSSISPDIVLSGNAERYLSSCIDDDHVVTPLIRYMYEQFYDSSKVGRVFYIALDAVFSYKPNIERYKNWANGTDLKLADNS